MSSPARPRTLSDLDFGILFFASGEDSMVGDDKYRFLLDCARYADANGFSSVWVPERHFTRFGCLYPNPSVLHAAVAMVTERVRLCAGSVVVPLHNPLRVAEEWSMVDNLSKGRVSLSIASGWNPDDFSLYPEKYINRRQEMLHALGIIRKAWRGEPIPVRNGAGKKVEVTIYPTPFQKELPIWVTSSGTVETFVRAGELGANLLTNLLDQDVPTLAEKILVYREARARHGHDPEAGVVSLMIHTFLSADAQEARDIARGPYCSYLKSNLGLAKGLAYNRGHSIDFDSLSDADLDAFLGFLYDRFALERALIGNVETCTDVVLQLYAAGVDEIAALLDFGPPQELVLANLEHLARLKDVCRARPEGASCRPRSSLAERGSVVPNAPAPEEPTMVESFGPAQLAAQLGETLAGAAAYGALAERGYRPSASLQRIEQVWRQPGEALVRFPAPAPDELEAVLLATAAQTALLALPEIEGEEALVPSAVRSVRLTGQPTGTLWLHAQLRSAPAEAERGFEAIVRALTDGGDEIAVLQGLRLAPFRSELPTVQVEEGVRDWMYELSWELGPTMDTLPELDPGAWLVLGDRTGVTEEVLALLAARGQRATVLEAGTYPPVGFDESDLSGASFRGLVDPFLSGELPCRGILHLWSLDAKPFSETTPETLLADQLRGSGSAVQLIQAVAAAPGNRKPRIWLATRGVHPLARRCGLAVAQAPIWAIGRTCAAEHPDLWGGLVDLDPEVSDREAAVQLLAAVLAGDREDQVAFAEGVRHVARLGRWAPSPEAPEFQVRSDGAYMVTGGLQGIGLEVGRWLADHGARHLILVGRTRLPDRDGWADLDPASPVGARVAAIAALEARGVEVHAPALDVADHARVAAFLEAYGAAGNPPIRGVYHAASVWRTPEGQGLVGPLTYTPLSSFRQVLPPKLIGAWVLQDLLRSEPLDAFVLFSAGAALIGSAGQGNYAAANAFLDTLVYELSCNRGLRALAVNWGPVSDVGFGATSEGKGLVGIWERRGIRGITPAEVLTAMELLVPSDRIQVGVLRADWTLLQQSYSEMLAAPWASRLVTAVPAPTKSDLPALLAALPPEEREEALALEVQRQVGVVMGFGPSEVPELDQGLFEIGLDSLLALELKNRVAGLVQRDFPITALFDRPTIASFSQYLLAEVLELPGGAAQAEAAASGPIDVLGRVEELSEEEVERLFAQKIAEGRA